MNYHDAYGVPGVVTRMFNNYGPRQNPRYVTGTIITQALERRAIELGAARSAARLLLLHRRRPRPPHGRRARDPRATSTCYGQGENVSMADWAALILRIGEEAGYWPAGREIVSTADRFRPGRERGDGAPRRLREAERARPAGSQASPGRRGPPDDRLVRGEPGELDRPRRLADADATAETPQTR